MSAPAAQTDIQAALLLLDRLGVTTDDLLESEPRRPAPTFTEYVRADRVLSPRAELENRARSPVDVLARTGGRAAAGDGRRPLARTRLDP